MKKILHTLIFVIAIQCGPEVFAQPCDLITPKFTVDLTGNPNGTWVSPSVTRDGYCCTASGSEVCIEFTLTLDSLANGISFNIASGAIPPGALYYQINCGTPILVGDPICLSGAGPHLLTFCKPGNNKNSFSITSIRKASVGVSVSDKATPQCPATVSAFGFIESSVTWVSIPSDATYEGYLNCLSGCDTLTITPSPGFPAFVDYVVCGNPVGGCGNSIMCDTVRVNFMSDVTVTVSPQNILLCNGVGTTVVTANASGGSGSYQYQWSSGQSSQSITAGAGTYSVTVTDTAVCSAPTDDVTINVLPPIIANAGPDISVCANQPNVTLSGSITTATSALWIGGSGTFNPNNSVLNAVYTPSSAELSNGFVNLILQTTGNQGCPGDTDAMRITIVQPPAPSIAGTIVMCENRSSGYSVPLVPGHSYSWTVTGGSIVGSSNTNAINVLWGHSGTGTVSITQTNGSGCSTTVTQNVSIIVLPNPNVSGSTDVCQFSTLPYFVNATPGSTYLWSVSGGALIGNSSSSSISVYWNAPASASVTLVETNSFGCSKTFVLPVTVKERPVPVINGNHTGCVNNTTSNYSSPFINNTSYNWSVTGGTIVSVNGANSVNVLWSASGVNTVTLQLVNNLTGCDSTTNLTVEVATLTPPIVTASKSSGCPPLTVSFNGNSPGPGQSYEWTFGDELYSSSSNPTHTFEKSGAFQVILISRNEAGCVDTAFGNVTVHNKPQSSFSHNYESSNYIVGESNLKLSNSSTGASHYLWIFGTTDTSNVFEPSYTYRETGDYILELHAINDYGCEDISFSLLRVRVKEHIFVPNAFSPNGDNINDYFSIESENMASIKIMIFNRWGDIFFTSDDPNFQWNGNYKGDPVELGIYGYMIKAKGENGSDYEVNGTLTLIR